MIFDRDVDWRLQVYGGFGGVSKRKLPSKVVREAVLKAQGNRCIYCEGEFDQYSDYKGIPTILNVEWDHFVPYAFTGSNNADNFVASCHLCNRLKSDAHYKTLDQARGDILPRRFIGTRGIVEKLGAEENIEDFQSRACSPIQHILDRGGRQCDCCQLNLHEYFYSEGSTRRTCIPCQRDCRGVKGCNLGRLWGCENCPQTPHPTVGHGGKQRLLVETA